MVLCDFAADGSATARHVENVSFPAGDYDLGSLGLWSRPDDTLDAKLLLVTVPELERPILLSSSTASPVFGPNSIRFPLRHLNSRLQRQHLRLHCQRAECRGGDFDFQMTLSRPETESRNQSIPTKIGAWANQRHAMKSMRLHDRLESPESYIMILPNLHTT